MQGLADNTIRDEAIAWHVRLNDGSDADWESFARWLDADPRHNDVYEAVCDADLALEPAVGLAREASSDARSYDSRSHDYAADVFAMAEQQERPRRRWMWPAMAASVAFVAIGTWATVGGLGGGYTVRTAPGESRTFALADGTRIVLNGGSEIALDKSDPREAELKSGEAQFTVHHDDAHPFTVTVGDQRIVDVGTVFNVRHAPDKVRVEVAEGAVRFEDGDTRAQLKAGDTLEAGGGRIVEGARPVGDIGGWTRGRLVYRDAPLTEVMADVTRSRGIAIAVDRGLSDSRFSGVIQLDGGDVALQKRIETLIGVKVTATADGWSISR